MHEETERRQNDLRLLRLEDKIIDQDKAITTLTGTHQNMSFILNSMQETLSEISHTLKKLADIEKQLVRYDLVEKDFYNKLSSLEKIQGETGCIRVSALAEKVKAIEDIKNKVIVAIFGSLATAITALVLK